MKSFVQRFTVVPWWIGFGLLLVLLAGQGRTLAVEGTAFITLAAQTVTADELRQHVAVLAADAMEGRRAGSRGGYAAGNYLANRLQSSGLQPAGEDGTFIQLFQSGYRNILGWIPGKDERLRQELVVIGAHYDHVGYGSRTTSLGPIGYIHNGADDNASGVAAILELIDAVAQTQWGPRRSVLFAFWDAEEQGLLGSQYWLSRPTLPGHTVVACLNLDMVGRLRDKLEVYGSRSFFGARRMVASANQQSGLELQFPWVLRADSDHYSFLSRRIPTLMLHTGLHEDYHRPSDDMEKLNYEGLRRIAILAFGVLYDWADSPSRPVFREGAFGEDDQTRESLEAPSAKPPGPLRVGISWRRDPADPSSLFLTYVMPQSPAWHAGLRLGDRVYRVDGLAFASDEELQKYLGQVSGKSVMAVETRGILRDVEVILPDAATAAGHTP